MGTIEHLKGRTEKPYSVITFVEWMYELWHTGPNSDIAISGQLPSRRDQGSGARRYGDAR